MDSSSLSAVRDAALNCADGAHILEFNLLARLRPATSRSMEVLASETAADFAKLARMFVRADAVLTPDVIEALAAGNAALPLPCLNQRRFATWHEVAAETALAVLMAPELIAIHQGRLEALDLPFSRDEWSGLDEWLRGIEAPEFWNGLLDRLRELMLLVDHDAIVANIRAEAARAAVTDVTPSATTTPTETAGKVRLSEAERDIIEAIRHIGPRRRRTQKAILGELARMAKCPSEGTTKTTLAAMVRHGILTDGYGLPEWGG